MGKICTKCKHEKLVTDYYKHKNGKDGLNPVCKICWKAENKLFEESKPRNEYRKARYEVKRPEIVEYQRKKYNNNIEFRLITLTRGRLNHFLKGRNKSESTKAILGIDLTGYKEYLEKQFTEGMSWENLGEWEIDHIIPVSKGGSFHYTNTQPLWKIDNRIKSNK